MYVYTIIYYNIYTMCAYIINKLYCIIDDMNITYNMYMLYYVLKYINICTFLTEWIRLIHMTEINTNETEYILYRFSVYSIMIY